ncbi:MAG: membrane protein insertase YidC [Clostridia bacterium]|nr:membrane protein insertase YidC [Clostridia bacterium]
MDFINMLCSSWPEGNFWASIIKLFDFIGSYAWIIIVFTIVLKLVLSPLDFLQKYYTNKTTRIQAKLQPELEKLQKRYGQNQTLLSKKQTELYAKHNFNMKGSCIVMIIYMVVTLTVFITFFSSLQTISNFKIKDQFETLQTTYNQSYEVEYLQDYLGVVDLNEYYASEDKAAFIETKEAEKLVADNTLTAETIANYKANCISNAQDKVVDKYAEIKDSWLWVKNIWRPDSSTAGQILKYEEFIKSTELNISEEDYNNIMGKLFTDEETSGPNGYYILSIIVVLVTFLSQWLTKKLTQPKRSDGKPVQQGGMGSKILMLVLPFIMFMMTMSSSALFAIYIITNSVLSSLINPLTTVICNKIEDKREEKIKNQNKAEYSR